MTIIDGAGTLIRPIFGAGVIQLLGYRLNTLSRPRWPLIFSIVSILIVLFFPHGLVGTWRTQRLEWRTTWSQRLRRLGRST
ncbi:MAG: hypothetical protein AAGF95_33980 [Chloroflexota bacterium]